jgi:hypothetical protein
VRGTREKAPKTSGLAWLLGIACFQRRLMEKHMHKQDPAEEEEEEEDHCKKRERMITISYAGLERSSWYGFPEAVGMICAGSNKEEKKNSKRSVFCSTVESLTHTHPHFPFCRREDFCGIRSECVTDRQTGRQT